MFTFLLALMLSVNSFWDEPEESSGWDYLQCVFALESEREKDRDQVKGKHICLYTQGLTMTPLFPESCPVSAGGAGTLTEAHCCSTFSLKQKKLQKNPQTNSQQLADWIIFGQTRESESFSHSECRVSSKSIHFTNQSQCQQPLCGIVKSTRPLRK